MPALVRFWHVKIHNCTYVGLTISPFAGKKSILNSILQCTKCSSWSSLDFLAAAVLRHQDFVITVYIAEEQQRNCREICGRCGQDFHLGFAPLFCLLNWLDGSVFLLVSFVDDDDQGLEGDDDLHLVFPFACLRAAASLKPTCLVIRVQGGETRTSRCFHAFQVVNAERLLPTHFMLLFWVFNSSCIIYMVLLQ